MVRTAVTAWKVWSALPDVTSRTGSGGGAAKLEAGLLLVEAGAGTLPWPPHRGHESKAERAGLNESSAAFEGQLRCGEHHDASAWNPGRWRAG